MHIDLQIGLILRGVGRNFEAFKSYMFLINPVRALSDGPNQIPLKDLPKHLRMLKAIHAAVS